LLGSGAILREVIAAADILERDYSVSATVWSATSFTELQRDGADAFRHNRLNPDAEQRKPWVSECLEGHEGPVIAATDYVRTFAEQIRPYLPNPDYTVLGTDGFGRSDTRKNLRRFFEVDSKNVVYTTLHALYKNGSLGLDELVKARKKLGLDPDKPNPMTV
jgi:pyruvate dehydrogenase E1 component